MAVTPKKRAAAVIDLIEGGSVREVANKHAIAQSTVGDWAAIINQLKKAGSDNERKEAAFHEELKKAAAATMRAVTTLAELLCDREYIRNLKTDELVVRFELVTNRVSRLIESERAFAGLGRSALQESNEPITPELVDEDEGSLAEVA